MVVDYQEHIKDEDKTNECLECLTPCEGEFCSSKCRKYYNE